MPRIVLPVCHCKGTQCECGAYATAPSPPVFRKSDEAACGAACGLNGGPDAFMFRPTGSLSTVVEDDIYCQREAGHAGDHRAYRAIKNCHPLVGETITWKTNK